MPIPDIANMKVADLKRELKVRGLPTTGNKNELQERLQTVMEVEPLLEESGISGEDLLDEDAVLSDEEEAKILNEHELLKSPLNTPTITELIKSDNNMKMDSHVEDELLNESHPKITPATLSSKKIVLKRKNSMTCVPSTASNVHVKSLNNVDLNVTKENAEPLVDEGKKIKMSERNPITLQSNNTQSISNKDIESKNIKKLSELSAQERLEMRAKKFGIDVSKNNTNAKTVSSNNDVISASVDDSKQIEILKKRAERFGCVTSKNLAKITEEGILLKRKRRFCIQAASADEWKEMARKRLERFKTESGNSIKTSDNNTSNVSN